MNIIVTGGAGFIGSNFLNLMVPRHPEHRFINVDVLTYAANLSNLQGLEGRSNYEFARIDIADRLAVGELFGRVQPNMVVHFAAESHVDRSIHAPESFITTNINGTFNLLEAFRSLPRDQVALFHHVSTDEVYGSLGPTGAFSETSPYDPSSPYSASKAASDHLVRAYHRTYGLPVKITNCSNNYGPYQFPEKLVPLMILNGLSGKPLPIYGKGDNIRDWLYVDDHARALTTVLKTGVVGETYNIGGCNERTNMEVVNTLCGLLDELVPHSFFAPHLSLITYVADRPGHDHRYAIDASKIERELGWKPAETFETGMRKTVQWYLDNSAWVRRALAGRYAGERLGLQSGGSAAKAA